MIRAFLAFDIPEEVTGRLARIVADFKEKERAVKWVKPGNMHVTMKFFGEVEEGLLIGPISEEIEGVTKSARPAALSCQGIGVFPNWKYPKVIWAGFDGKTGEVMDLQAGIEDVLQSFDIQRDKRAFRLHLTLGRTRGVLKNSPLVELVEKLGPVSFGKVEVERLILYKSELAKKGPIYTPLREYRLLGE